MNPIATNAERSRIMRELITLNKRRDKVYIRIKHLIDSCTNYSQAKQCENMVDAFCSKGGGNAADLRKHYGAVLMRLNPEKPQLSAADDIIGTWNRIFK